LGPNSGVFPLEQTRHVGVAKSEHPVLTNGEIIFEELHTYIYIYEIYNALHSRGWLESEARAVARWRGLGRNGRKVECF